jgi:hypothetical protein
MLVSGVLIAFQLKPVQTWAAKKAAVYLSKELGAKVYVGGLYIKPFSSVVLDTLTIFDKQKDTLANIPKLTADVNFIFRPKVNISIFGHTLVKIDPKRQLDIKSVHLDNTSFYLKRLKDSSTNLSFILNHFKSKDTTKSTGTPWQISFGTLVISNLHFKYKNSLSSEPTGDQVNFNDADVKNFNIELSGIDIKHHLFKADIHDLSFNERSGFHLKHFVANATVDTNQILLTKLYIQTNRSVFKDYFRMRFASFDDFSDYVNKVNMDANFKQSQISSLDVAYFTNSLTHIFFDLSIDGHIKGPVNSLKAKNLAIVTGQATYVKGDFSVRGLPNWNKTFLDLRFEQIATNKKDAELLLNRFTGKKNQTLPDIVGKFGNINFKGQFTGFQKDFIAYGEFKTKLGRFTSDINLKLDKNNTPSYSGKINTFDFDLGSLTDQELLGRTTLSTNIKGTGFQLNQLAAQLNAYVTYFDFKGYRYNNLTVNGNFLKKKFDGTLLINDHNINLIFAGDVDLNNSLPQFNFNADVKGANLSALNLYKDSVIIDSKIASNFTGNNINNIDGSILLQNIKLQKAGQTVQVDSIYFAAKDTESARQLVLRSDIAEGNLKGNYDLASLPAYFKAIAKKYLPSLKTDIAPFKPQRFDFDLKVKNLDAISLLFVPRLKLIDTASFIGQFNSAEKTATVTGSVKNIKYGKYVFHDIIIDESTNDETLNLNVALRRLDITDSLFIKDINITNFLKRDSLNFNVKLSDKNAINQLDLYGAVAFGKDSITNLDLLPSDIILEHQVWKLEDKSRVSFFNDGKIQFKGLGISYGQQRVKIDGLVSSDPADQLVFDFSKFNMNTLDQLTRPAGILLDGTVNGDVKLSSLTTKPAFNSNLAIDSMAFNKTLIGNVKFATQLDAEKQVLNTKLNIFNRGLETFTASGIYDLGSPDKALDFDVKMNQTEAIIIDPFVKSLISDLKGTLSSNLKVTGTLSKPVINGDLTFVNTGLTVNYLRTPYVLNDKITVENSTVNIKDLILRDNRGGKGTINGTVDLTDLSDLVLDVNVKAENLLALNTTFKDNRLYYGTAYGTGDFSFEGPLDSMQIGIKAKTEQGTVFNIPLNTSSKAAEYDFIRFVSSKDTTGKLVGKTNSFRGLTLNFDLSADDKTIVKIYTDYGLLTGNGTANDLLLKINSFGDFEMYGDYNIISGKFEFTAKNFITKNFSITDGGSIKWTGNPQNAEINLNAIYEVRADIKDLFAAAGISEPTKLELVQAQLKLTKSLIQPQIDFDFNFPNDPSIKDQLGTYLNDPTNRSLQAVSLIARREFASGNNTNSLGNQVQSTATDALSEFAFNKINAVIAQSNLKNLDINIRSQTDASASFHLFNDRLLINGSQYISNASTQALSFSNQSSTLFSANSQRTYDFGIQYLIKKDGSLLGTYSYRVLNSDAPTITSSLEYVNGFGLAYRRDFDTFGEFLKNIFGKKPVVVKTDINNKPIIKAKPDETTENDDN